MLLRLDGAGTLTHQICSALRDRILRGELPAGERILGSRTLALELGVSRIVVLAAFEQLVAEGYLEASVGAGTRVAVRVPPRPAPAARRRKVETSQYAKRAAALVPHRTVASRPAAKGVVDFSYTTAQPDERTLRGWRQAVARSAHEAGVGYPDVAGELELRRALAAHLRRHRGVVADAGDVVIVSGSQQALDLVARMLCDDGTPVGIEDPHYQGARQVFEAAGARIVPCDLDDRGFDIGRHGKRLADARALYLTPSHQLPTGAIMSIDRRLALLQWASRRRVWIVEDDYDNEFRYGGAAIPALRSLDTSGCVFYLGTFARTLFPELRLGYVVVPPALRETFHAMKWLNDRGTPPLGQRAVAAMLESGAYERSTRRLWRSLESKHRLLLDALRASFSQTDVTWAGSHAGTHLFLRFPEIAARRTDAFVAHAERAGVRVYSGMPYFMQPPSSARLICGYAAVAPRAIEPGILRLAQAYQTFPSA